MSQEFTFSGPGSWYTFSLYKADKENHEKLENYLHSAQIYFSCAITAGLAQMNFFFLIKLEHFVKFILFGGHLTEENS